MGAGAGAGHVGAGRSLPASVYIGRLEPITSSRDLYNRCIGFCKPERARVVACRQTGQCKGKDPVSFCKINMLNGTGRTLLSGALFDNLGY